MSQLKYSVTANCVLTKIYSRLYPKKSIKGTRTLINKPEKVSYTQSQTKYWFNV